MAGNYDFLLRDVTTSKKYDTYFKNSRCEVVSQGFGNTDKTLKVLKKLTYEYQQDTKKLTKKFFKTQNLQQLVTQINNWLFSTFQYKVGGFEQNISSPNCAYSKRFDGIDCKTYSLIAGTILLNKGINFNFRKSKQQGESSDKWTHVYLTIPVNQQTNNLKEGYYLIDGTVAYPNENQVVKTKDIFMADKFPHYGLRAPEATTIFDRLLDGLSQAGLTDNTLLSIKHAFNSYTEQGINPKVKAARNNNGIYIEDVFVYFEYKQGLNGGGNPYEFNGGGSDGAGLDLLSLFGGLDLGNIISGILDGSLFCGNSAWGQREFDRYSSGLERYINPILSNLSNNLDVNQFQIEINKLSRAGAMFAGHFQSKIDRGYNSCSTKVLKSLRDLGLEIVQNVEFATNSASTNNTVTTTITTGEPVNFRSINMNEDNDGHLFDYTIYTIVANQNSNNNNANNNNNTNNNSTNNNPIIVANTTGNGTVPIIKPIVQKETKTSYAPVLIGAGILAKIAGIF